MAERNDLISSKEKGNSETKAMDIDDSTATGHLITEIQRIIDLTEPARCELTKLKNEVYSKQEFKMQQESSEISELPHELHMAKERNSKLAESVGNIQKALQIKTTDLDDANSKLLHLEESTRTERGHHEKVEAQNRKTIGVYKEVNDNLLKRIQLHSEEIESLKILKQKSDDIIRKQKEDIKRLGESLKLSNIERFNIAKELSDTKTRLSKLMGDKLSDNNPDIADLSDEFRPTKLAEKYQELYDNQWTDAFESAEKYFSKKSEKTRITVLRRILQNVYKFCIHEAEKQEKDFLEAMFKTHDTKELHSAIPDSIQTKLKELKRYAVFKSSENLFQKFLMECDKTSEIGRFTEHSESFVHECVNLCWHMVNQNPPVVLHLSVKSGDKFDSGMYKQYTATGIFVDFVVWPALLLYENGSVLSKGVVQCVKLHEASQSVRVRSQKVTATEMGIPTGSLRLSNSTTQGDVTDLQQTMTQFESNQTVMKTMHRNQTGKSVKKHSEINVKLSLATENTEIPGQLEQSSLKYSIKDDHKQLNNSPGDNHQYSLKVNQPKQNNAQNLKSKQNVGEFNDMHISSENIQHNETASDYVKQFQGQDESSKQNPLVSDNVQQYPLHAGTVSLIEPNNPHSSSYYPNSGTFQQDHSNSNILQQQQQQQLQKQQHQQKEQQQQLPQNEMRQQQEEEQEQIQQQHEQQQVHQQQQQQPMEHQQQRQVHQQQQQQQMEHPQQQQIQQVLQLQQQHHQEQQQQLFQNLSRSNTGAGQDSSNQSSPQAVYQNWISYPTQQEYDFFISNLNAGVNLMYIRVLMGEQAFQKCWNYYQLWLKSLQNSETNIG